MATVTVRYEDDTVNPVAKMTAVHISATGVDITDETTNAELRYYMTAECAGQDTAKSVVFSGDFDWHGWVAPAAGAWTFHLRADLDDSSVANSGVITFS
jgi:hypothetical protein